MSSVISGCCRKKGTRQIISSAQVSSPPASHWRCMKAATCGGGGQNRQTLHGCCTWWCCCPGPWRHLLLSDLHPAVEKPCSTNYIKLVTNRMIWEKRHHFTLHNTILPQGWCFFDGWGNVFFSFLQVLGFLPTVPRHACCRLETEIASRCWEWKVHVSCDDEMVTYPQCVHCLYHECWRYQPTPKTAKVQGW